MKKLFLLFLLALTGFTAQAQDVTPANSPAARRTILKTSPIDLLLPHKTTLWLGVEHQVKSKWSGQLDLGYIFRDNGLFDLSEYANNQIPTTDRSRFNFNLKTELRHYLSKRQPGLNGFYTAGQVMFRQVHYNSNRPPRYDWTNIGILFTDFGESWAYRQGPESSYRSREQSTALNVKLGYQHVFRSRFTLDTFLGLGVRRETVRHEKGEQQPDSYDYRLAHGGVVVPLPVFGFKIGVAL